MKKCGRGLFLEMIPEGLAVLAPISGNQTVTATANNAQVDITDKQSDGWRTLKENCGIRAVDINWTGFFVPTHADDLVSRTLAGSIDTYSIIDESGDRMLGSDFSALITRCSVLGEFGGAMLLALDLAVTGPIDIIPPVPPSSVVRSGIRTLQTDGTFTTIGDILFVNPVYIGPYVGSSKVCGCIPANSYNGSFMSGHRITNGVFNPV